VTVADMIVTGGDYTFTGNNVGIHAKTTDTTLTGATGSLDIQGGKVTLASTGEHNFEGGVRIASGASLQLGANNSGGTLVGNIANDGSVIFSRSSEITYTGNISGNGDVTQAGSGGTLTLTGTNTYTGDTTVSAGTLAGNIANNTNLTVAAGATYDGNGAPRSVSTLNGGGNVINPNGLTVQSGTFAGVISGAGSVTKTSAGTLTLSGNNTYTGNTNITGGTLAVTGTLRNGNYAGAIANDGSLIFNQTADQILSGNISGTGSLTKQRSGSLFLNGANTYTGDTTVAAGLLGGNGSISGSNLIVKSGATFSPGSNNDSTGTFTVNNAAVTFETDSMYRYEIDMTATGHDLLVVNNGDVFITNGAKLEVQFLRSGRPSDGESFLVIDAATSQFVNEVSGEKVLFTIPGNLSRRFDHEIKSDGYWITYTASNLAGKIQRYGTPNAIRAAEGVDEIDNLGLSDGLGGLYDALLDLDAADDRQGLADAFAQLHGEVFASNKEAAAQLQRRFLRHLPTAQERLLCDEFCVGEWNRWATLTGDWRERKNIGLYSGYDLRMAGVAVGFDRHIERNTLVGLAFGYDNAFQDFRTIRSQNTMDSFRAVLYKGWWNGNHFANAYAGYTRNEHQTRRNIDINNTLQGDTFSAVARSKYGDNMFSTGFEFGRELSSGLAPSLGMHYIYSSNPNVTETGSGVANLHVHGGNYHSLRMPMGAKWSRTLHNITGDHDITWTPELRAFYVRELADDSARVRTSFDSVREVSFAAESGKWGRDSARLGAGLETCWVTGHADRLSFRLDYDCELYKHTTTNTLAATVGVNW